MTSTFNDLQNQLSIRMVLRVCTFPQEMIISLRPFQHFRENLTIRQNSIQSLLSQLLLRECEALRIVTMNNRVRLI